MPTQPLRDNHLNEPATRLSWQTEVMYVAVALDLREITRGEAAKRLRQLVHEREGD